MTSPHQPLRPSWLCASCAQDWPCERRRAELLGEGRGASAGPQSTVPVALLMADYFQDAVHDHSVVLVSTLYARFFGWLRASADHLPPGDVPPADAPGGAAGAPGGVPSAGAPADRSPPAGQ